MSTNVSPILLLILVALCSAAAKFNGHNRPNTGEPGGVIVHLMDWRYDDIAYECKTVLSKKGFAGVQISPVTEYLIINTQKILEKWFGKCPWYKRHQVASYEINTPSGNEQEFIDMVRKCNRAGVKVYVDVILNHMTASHETDNKGYACNIVDSVNFNYPAVPYTQNDFNQPTCKVDERSATKMRNCEFCGLHDLNQTNPCVREKMRNFLNKLISFGVAGFRVGHVKHMWPEDLKKLFGRLDYLNCDEGFACETPPYIYQDFFGTDDKSSVKATEYYPTGFVVDHKYAMKVSNVFYHYEKPVNFDNIKNAWGLLDSDKSVVFVDTYETQKETKNSVSFQQSKLYKLAVALLLASPHGQPLITSSYINLKPNGDPPYTEKDSKYVATNQQETCAENWICEHRRKFVYGMLRFRDLVGDAPVTNWWHDGRYQFAFSRGDKGFVLFNNNPQPITDQRFKTGLPKGFYCDVINGDITNEGECTGGAVKVDEDGYANVVYLQSSDRGGGVLALHKASQM